MKNTIVFPGRYVQGPGVIWELPEHIQKFGGRGFFIATSSMYDTMCGVARICNSVVERFPYGCDRPSIDAMKQIAQREQATVVIGVGGGRPLDTGRVVADELDLPYIAVPTVASSDAACSFLSIVNKTPEQGGGVAEFHFCKTNPVLVMADEELIIGAKPYLLACGMADALSTWFEAESCQQTGALCYSGGTRTDLAMCIARLCYDQVMLYGRDAMKAAREGVITPAFSKIVETNILISGCGFGGCGLATAHGMHGCFEGIPTDDGKHYEHGQLVAFSILIGMWLNKKTLVEIEAMYSLFYDIGMPITLEDIGYTNITDQFLDDVTAFGLKDDFDGFPYRSFVYNEPVELNHQVLRTALVKTQEFGKAYYARMNQ